MTQLCGEQEGEKDTMSERVVPRRRQAEEIEHRLGRLHRRKLEAKVPCSLTASTSKYKCKFPDCLVITQAAADQSLPPPPKKQQSSDISDIMSR